MTFLPASLALVPLLPYGFLFAIDVILRWASPACPSRDHWIVTALACLSELDG